VLFRDEARVVHKTLECLEQALGIVGNIVIRLQPHGLSHGAIQVGLDTSLPTNTAAFLMATSPLACSCAMQA
jgi:hypothetical protein